jgi:hypothetical protein
MTGTFAITGSTTHSTVVTGLTGGNSYAFYVRCMDAENDANLDDLVITFSVATPSAAISNFTGAENPLSENGIWDSPGAWADLQKNNGAFTTSSNAQARLVTPARSPDQYVEITYDRDPGASSWVGVTTRMQSAGNGSGYLAIAYWNEVQLYRADDSGSLNFALLAAAPVTIGTAPRRLRLVSQGAVHTVYFNGIQVISHTASGTVYSSGQPGIAASVFGGPQVKILSFESGDVGPSGAAPPVRSNGQPVGVLPATTEATLSLTTDESATCRYSPVPGVAFGSMTGTFATTGTTTHSTVVTGLSGGSSYAFYVRCMDAESNANTDDFVVTFSVATPSAAISNFTGAENPLSENGTWDSPGTWADLQKNNGAFATGINAQARLVTPARSPDQYVEITYDRDPGTSSWVGVTTRMQSAGNGSGYLAIAYSNEVQLYRADDSGSLNFTLLAAAPVTIGTAPRRLRLVSQGDTHTVYFNGVQSISHTASGAVYSSGQPGIAASVFGGPQVKILSFESGETGPPNAAPPVRFNGQPVGVLPAGTTQATLTLITDENATCRYSPVAGVAFESMTASFATTGTTTHSTGVTGLTNGGGYAFYVRCIDAESNANTDDFVIMFSVAAVPVSVISVAPPAGSTAVALTAAVSAAFGGDVAAGTVTASTFQLLDPAAVAVPATVAYDAQTRTGTLQPLNALSNSTVYTVVVRGGPNGVKDAAGTPLANDFTASFTTVGPSFSITDTTVADFAAGTVNAGAYVSHTTDGEIILTPAIATEFNGSAPPPGWTTTPLDGGGTATVSAGQITADGAALSFNTFLPRGQSFESDATFSTDATEAVGFVSATASALAIFTTSNGTLHAYATDGVRTPTDIVIPGSWLGSPHRFRIDWGTSAIVFSIDGGQVASIALSIPTNMAPALFDITTGQGALKVDWIRLTPYATSGTFTSQVLNAGVAIPWTSASWTAQVPAGSSLAMSARFGNTAVPDASWTPFTALPTSGGSPAQTSQYVQYRAVLTGNGSVTPVLRDVSFGGSAPPTSIAVADASVVEGNAGTVNAGFVLTLSRASTTSVSVAYSTADNTATAASDYTAVAGTAVFPPGTTSVNVNVPVIGETAIETDESFFLNLGAASNATVSRPQAVGTIVNDDSPILTVNSASVTEGDSGSLNATFTVTLTPASTQTVTVAYATADGTAKSGSDYTAVAGTLTFAPGATTQTVAVSVLGDLLDEANETFTVNLSGPTNAVASTTPGTGTIVDNNDPSPSIAIGDTSVSEGNSGTKTGSLVVSLSAPSGLTITVNYATANGTAAAGSDYVTTSGTLTFAPGVTSSSIPITVSGDSTYEADETVLVNLSAPVNSTIADLQGILTITNDDLPQLTINSVSVTESDSGSVTTTFTVTLAPASSQTVSVAYATANGTATAGSDYTAASGTLSFPPGATSRTINISTLGDLLDETTETFTVNLSNPVNAVVATAQGTGTIIDDNDPSPSIAIGNAGVTEGNSGTKIGSLVATLSAPSGLTITVNYATANGTATSGSDYVAGSGTVTFTPGVTSQSIPVTIVGDTAIESDQTVLVNLSGATNASIADSQGVLTITNDDLPQLTINSVSITEGNAQSVTATFTVTLAPAVAQTVTVGYSTANVTATSGADYTATSGTLSFSPGATTRSISITVPGDTRDEANETFAVNLASPVNAVIATAQGIGTIVDNDPTPSIDIANISVTEGNTGTKTASFAVTLSAASGQTVTAGYATANGTATAGSDYVAAANTLTFAPGVTSVPIVVTVNGDALNEANETVLVNLSNATNASIADSQATLTITNDDPVPSITIADASITEGNSGTKIVTVNLSLSAASGRTVTVNYATANGTASAGSDYVGESGSVTFAAGTTTAAITVTINGDNTREPNQTFLVNLSGPSNATLARTAATVTILNDD